MSLGLVGGLCNIISAQILIIFVRESPAEMITSEFPTGSNLALHLSSLLTKAGCDKSAAQAVKQKSNKPKCLSRGELTQQRYLCGSVRFTFSVCVSHSQGQT